MTVKQQIESINMTEYTVKSEFSDELDSDPYSHSGSGKFITRCPHEAKLFMKNYIDITGNNAWIEETTT